MFRRIRQTLNKAAPKPSAAHNRAMAAAILAYVKGVQSVLVPGSVPNTAVEAKELIAAMTIALTKEAERAGAQGLRELGIKASFALDNPEAIRWAAQKAARDVTFIDASVRHGIATYTSEAIKAGIPPRDLAKQIREIVGLRPDQMETLAKYSAQLLAEGRASNEVARLLAARTNRMLRQRALLIARTGTTTAQAKGLEIAWSKAQDQGMLPPTAVKTWIASGGPRTTEICRELDGQQRPIGVPFNSSIVGQVQSPSAHPN